LKNREENITPDNVYEYIKNILGKDFNFNHIIDRELTLDLQMEFSEMSQKIINTESDKELNDEFYEASEKILFSDADLHAKKELLIQLSNCKNPKAYRIIEKFEKSAGPDLNDWAYMALRTSQMKLESYFLENNAVLITSGLGSFEGKLRYFVGMFSENEESFSEVELKTIKNELLFHVEREKGILEKFEAGSSFIKVLVLLPLNMYLRQFFIKVIDSCKELGVNLSKSIALTNVQAMKDEELEQFIANAKKRKEED
jgi:hypothetical protein